eukprot:2521014-Alexandrium_andersonii.AAC.1
MLDLRKAYPSVQRDTLWLVLSRAGMALEGNMMRTLKGLHEMTFYSVRVQNSLGERYWPARGLREGCPSSP